MIALAILAAMLIVGLVGFGIFWIAQRSREDDLKGLPPGARALPASQQEMWRTGNRMARLLDQTANDPMRRTSATFEEEARALVEEWWS